MDEEWESITTQHSSHMDEIIQRQPSHEHASSAVLSLTPPLWLPDSFASSCAQCCLPFKALIRLRHHCRLCGLIFCASCSSEKLLLPPKFLAKEPQRVCVLCHALLAPVQTLLASSVSQASRVPVFDAHDNISLRSFFNLPFHSTLEGDLFKASNIVRSLTRGSIACGTSLRSSSVIKSIPSSDSKLLVTSLSSPEPIYALAVLTSLRLGAGWSGSLGTGVVVRRQSREEGGGWSAPCAVSLMGLGWGLQFGGEVTDIVLTFRSQEQLLALISSEGRETIGTSFGSLGGSLGASLGPLGRRADASLVNKNGMKPSLSYSRSKGIFLGCSIEGSCLSIRSQVNTKFYGRQVSAFDLLHPCGQGVPPPPAASNLYDSLHALNQKMDMAAPPPYSSISNETLASHEMMEGEGTSMMTSVSACLPSADLPEASEEIEESPVADLPEDDQFTAVSKEDEGESEVPEPHDDERLPDEDEPDEEEEDPAVEDKGEERDEERAGEEEIVWGFTSAWGCTPTLRSSSLPSLPEWRKEEEREEGASVGGLAAFFPGPLSSPLDPSSSHLTSEYEPRLTSIKSKAEDECYQWNLFD